MPEDKVIHSKGGVATKVTGAGLVLMGLVVLAAAISGVGSFDPVWAPILIGALGLFMVALGIDEGFRAAVEVTPDRVRVKKWGRWEEHSLRQIDLVNLQRDLLGFGGFVMVLVSRGKPPIQVHLRQYQNRAEIAREILQAIWSHNREVVVSPRVQRHFGHPPYSKK